MFAYACPYAVVLPGVQREGQALPPDGAAAADRLRLRDPIKGGTRCGDREEQFTIGMPACGQQPLVPAGMVIIWSPGGREAVVICGRDR